MPRAITFRINFRMDPDGNREGRGRFGYYVVIGTADRWQSRYVNETGTAASTASAHCGSEGMAMAWCDAHERALGEPTKSPVLAPVSTTRPPRPQLALLPSDRPDRAGRR
jgi:hypothetical protein